MIEYLFYVGLAVLLMLLGFGLLFVPNLGLLVALLGELKKRVNEK